MTTHEVRLHPKPFAQIKDGEKEIEMRLNDEKRQKIAVGDQIEFVLRPDFFEKITVEVTDLIHAQTFGELITMHPLQKFGIPDTATIEDMYKHYSQEDEQKYGVVGIQFRII